MAEELLTAPPIDVDAIVKGAVEQALKKYEEAIKDFNKALELNPLFSEAEENKKEALDANSVKN